MKTCKKTTATLLTAIFALLIVSAIPVEVQAQATGITIDGVISEEEWGAPDFTGVQSNPNIGTFNIYIENDESALYIAAKYTGSDFSPAQELGLATALNIFIDSNNNGDVVDAPDNGDRGIIISNDELFLPYDPPVNDWNWQGSGSLSAAGGQFAVDGDYVTGNGIVEVKIPFSLLLGVEPGSTIGVLFQAFGYDYCPYVEDVHSNWPSTYTDFTLWAPPSEVWVDDDADPEWYKDPTHFQTIHGGIDAVASGGTVYVAAGTYTENVVIEKSLTLQGDVDDPSNVVIDASGFGKGIEIRASSVTIRGLTVKNAQRGIDIYASVDDITIDSVIASGNVQGIDVESGCIVHNLVIKKVVSTKNSEAGFRTGTDAEVYGLTVIDSHFDYNGKGFVLFGLTDGLSITDSTFNYNTGEEEACGLYTGWGKSYEINWIIENSEFIGNSPGTKFSCGMALMTIYNELSNVNIDRCIFGEEEVGIELGVGVPGEWDLPKIPENRESAKVSNVVIKNCNFSNLNYAIRAWEKADANATVTSFQVHYCNIEGNVEYGIVSGKEGEDYSPLPTVVNATLNWWGSAAGPNATLNTYNKTMQGDRVSGNVDFAPWLDAPYPGGSSFAPVQNLNTTEQFASIQAAIDDEDTSQGHTILVHPGTYNETVTLNKGITLVGEAGATILKGVHITSNNVTLKGFKIGSEAILGESACVYLAPELSNVEVSDNELVGSGKGVGGRGVLLGVYSGSSNYTNILIEYNKIHDLATGIYTNPHTGVIVIEYNEIWNTQAGIGGLTGAVVRNNTISNSDEGIGVDNTYDPNNTIIKNNSFSDNAIAIKNYGTKTVNVTLNDWGVYTFDEIEALIYHKLDDPSLGEVVYAPWIAPEEVPPPPSEQMVETVTNTTVPNTVDATDVADVMISVNVTSPTSVIVANHTDNPHPEASMPEDMLPKYVEIAVGNRSAVEWPMYVELHYTDEEVAAAGMSEVNLGLYYFKDGSWHRCRNTGVDVDNNFIWAYVDEDEYVGSPYSGSDRVSYDLTLYPEWNLISPPLIPEDTSILERLQPKCSRQPH